MPSLLQIVFFNMVDASTTSSVSPVWWVYSLLLGVFWLFCYWLDNFVFTFIVCMIGGVIGEVVIGFIPEDLMKGHGISTR